MNASDVAEWGRDWSTYCVSYGTRWVITCVPNAGEQELVGAFGRAVLSHALPPLDQRGIETGPEVEFTAAPSGPAPSEAA